MSAAGKDKVKIPPPPRHAPPTQPPLPSPSLVPADWSLDQPLVVALLVTFLLIILTTLYFLVLRRKKGNSIILIGPTEAGKTSIFVHLLNKTGKETVTSTVPNVAEYTTQNGAVLLLKDLPGHDRVRTKFWDKNKSRPVGIICVLDAAGGSKAVRDSAEVLYTVLTDSEVTSVKPRVLVLANKQDLASERAVNLKNHLEKELTTLRVTKSAGLKTTGGRTVDKQLGNPDVDFEFDQMLPIKVDFRKSCAKPGKADLGELVEWLEVVGR